ncbi:MAG TPA: hypothetical protein VGM01_13270, partial [Ktedonobacteraceae bacterium]
ILVFHTISPSQIRGKYSIAGSFRQSIFFHGRACQFPTPPERDYYTFFAEEELKKCTYFFNSSSAKNV